MDSQSEPVNLVLVVQVHGHPAGPSLLAMLQPAALAAAAAPAAAAAAAAPVAAAAAARAIGLSSLEAHSSPQHTSQHIKSAPQHSKVLTLPGGRVQVQGQQLPPAGGLQAAATSLLQQLTGFKGRVSTAAATATWSWGHEGVRSQVVHMDCDSRPPSSSNSMQPGCGQPVLLQLQPAVAGAGQAGSANLAVQSGLSGGSGPASRTCQVLEPSTPPGADQDGMGATGQQHVPIQAVHQLPILVPMHSLEETCTANGWHISSHLALLVAGMRMSAALTHWSLPARQPSNNPASAWPCGDVGLAAASTCLPVQPTAAGLPQHGIQHAAFMHSSISGSVTDPAAGIDPAADPAVLQGAEGPPTKRQRSSSAFAALSMHAFTSPTHLCSPSPRTAEDEGAGGTAHLMTGGIRTGTRVPTDTSCRLPLEAPGDGYGNGHSSTLEGGGSEASDWLSSAATEPRGLNRKLQQHAETMHVLIGAIQHDASVLGRPMQGQHAADEAIVADMWHRHMQQHEQSEDADWAMHEEAHAQPATEPDSMVGWRREFHAQLHGQGMSNAEIDQILQDEDPILDHVIDMELGISALNFGRGGIGSMSGPLQSTASNTTQAVPAPALQGTAHAAVALTPAVLATLASVTPAYPNTDLFNTGFDDYLYPHDDHSTDFGSETAQQLEEDEGTQADVADWPVLTMTGLISQAGTAQSGRHAFHNTHPWIDMPNGHADDGLNFSTAASASHGRQTWQYAFAPAGTASSTCATTGTGNALGSTTGTGGQALGQSKEGLAGGPQFSAFLPRQLPEDQVYALAGSPLRRRRSHMAAPTPTQHHAYQSDTAQAPSATAAAAPLSGTAAAPAAAPIAAAALQGHWQGALQLPRLLAGTPSSGIPTGPVSALSPDPRVAPTDATSDPTTDPDDPWGTWMAGTGNVRERFDSGGNLHQAGCACCGEGRMALAGLTLLDKLPDDVLRNMGWEVPLSTPAASKVEVPATTSAMHQRLTSSAPSTAAAAAATANTAFAAGTQSKAATANEASCFRASQPATAASRLATAALGAAAATATRSSDPSPATAEIGNANRHVSWSQQVSAGCPSNSYTADNISSKWWLFNFLPVPLQVLFGWNGSGSTMPNQDSSLEAVVRGSTAPTRTTRQYSLQYKGLYRNAQASLPDQAPAADADEERSLGSVSGDGSESEGYASNGSADDSDGDGSSDTGSLPESLVGQSRSGHTTPSRHSQHKQQGMSQHDDDPADRVMDHHSMQGMLLSPVLVGACAAAAFAGVSLLGLAARLRVMQK